MKNIAKYFRIWIKNAGIALSEDMAYKANFFIKIIAIALTDFLGPLIAVLIYSNSSGIPGWTFEEFILFTGTFTLIFGLGHALVIMMPHMVIESVRRGEFDKYMVKPFNPLVLLSISCWDMDGFAEVFTGLALVIWSMTKIGVTLPHLGLYLLLVIVGIIFQYAGMVLISAIAFRVVKSYSLYDLFFEISKFARYPLTIFGPGVQLIFTFLFPVAISSHYPVEALLRGASLLTLLKISIPVMVFLAFSIWLWEQAMKHYSSAGG